MMERDTSYLSISNRENAGVPTSIPPPSHHILSDFIFLFNNFIFNFFTESVVGWGEIVVGTPPFPF
jgi:hypothetical protein